MTANCQSASTKIEGTTGSKKSFSHQLALENIQKRYGDLIYSSSIIAYVSELHPPYAPIYVGKGIELLGYAEDDFCNTSDFWLRLLHEEDRERVLREVEKAFSEKKEIDCEYRLRARDNSIYWVHEKANFVFDENGEPLRREGLLLGITKRNSSEPDGKKNNAKIDLSLDGNKPKRILLVEDEKIIREMMREILSNDGYQITTAENGVEALDICQAGEKSFDLLITDFEMPQMNGRELAEKLKVSCDSMKILFVSGYAGDDDFLRDLSSDGKYFVAKPFSPDSLAEKVKAVLEEE